MDLLTLSIMLARFAAPAAFAPGSGAPDSVVYRLLPESRLEVKTGKAGLLGFAGHTHLIRARAFSGTVVYFPSDPKASRVEIRVPTDSLEVLTPPDTAEIRKVTASMRTEVLQVDRYPEIRLVSTQVTPAGGGVRLMARLTLVGETRDVPIDLATTVGPDTLRASGTFSIRQTDFGITPYRGGPGGTVKVADRVTFRVDLVAARIEGVR
jgi:polyisoprenoid-binding protein YceI